MKTSGQSLTYTSSPEIEAAWKVEIERRIEEIESGKIKGVPPEKVAARIQKILKWRIAN